MQERAVSVFCAITPAASSPQDRAACGLGIGRGPATLMQQHRQERVGGVSGSELFFPVVGSHHPSAGAL